MARATALLADAKLGNCDGNEIGDGRFLLFFSGPSSEELYELLTRCAT